MSKSKLISIYETTIEKWKNNKCSGSVLLSPPLNPNEVVLLILQKTYNRDPTSNVMLVVSDFKERTTLVNALTHTGDKENDDEFKSLIDSKILRIYTHDFLTRWGYRDEFKIAIFIGINDYTANMDKLFRLSKFKFIILTKLIEDNKVRANLYKDYPLVYSINHNELTAINTNSPVEETHVPVTISNVDDIDKLNKYNEYIKNSMSIFSNFDIMMKASHGDTINNISSFQYCEKLAADNGWRNDLDMSIGFNIQIDEAFNPSTIYERAETTFSIIRERGNLVSSIKDKLDIILFICEENSNKRILIVSKSSNFASEITSYINSKFGSIDENHPICANYHNDVCKIPAYTDDGKPILIKSGKNAGMQKMLASEAQKKLFNRLFNEGKVRILSTNNSPDKSLTCSIDLLIITSPLCISIKELKYRLDGVQFNSLPNKVIRLYCEDTIEEMNILKEAPQEFHSIINNRKISSTYDENIGVTIVR